ncbi:MAG: helix-turn-helix transcriptional regulator [Actinobacteria bacterium]|nr:helix-turn-helix transcriptional regulator [Actinomycetota bacterium]
MRLEEAWFYLHLSRIELSGDITTSPACGPYRAEQKAWGMEVLESFGENLLRIRQARKLSQESLAERAGIHRTQVSMFETGQRQPRGSLADVSRRHREREKP